MPHSNITNVFLIVNYRLSLKRCICCYVFTCVCIRPICVLRACIPACLFLSNACTIVTYQILT